MSKVQFGFAVVAIFMATAVTVVGLAMWLGRFVRPHRPDPYKNQPYECGELPIGGAWFNFNPRFYQIALLFLIFDVEIALTFPVAVVVRDWIGAGNGLLAATEIGLFLAVLMAALAYLWARGDLDWLRDIGILTREQDPIDESTHQKETT